MAKRADACARPCQAHAGDEAQYAQASVPAQWRAERVTTRREGEGLAEREACHPARELREHWSDQYQLRGEWRRGHLARSGDGGSAGGECRRRASRGR
eukprot:scaffold149031_cov35-Tisochrysis_lutea.AAC.2